MTFLHLSVGPEDYARVYCLTVIIMGFGLSIGKQNGVAWYVTAGMQWPTRCYWKHVWS